MIENNDDTIGIAQARILGALAGCPASTGSKGRSLKKQSFESIARALNDLKVPYILVGGMAVIAHGYGRSTQDLDIVVRLDPAVVRGAFVALASLGYAPRVPVTAAQFADETQRKQWIAEKGMMVLNFHSDRHAQTPVDVFVSEPFDFLSEYESALIVNIAPDVPVRVLRLETLMKLKREAGRKQDLADVAELEALHGREPNA